MRKQLDLLPVQCDDANLFFVDPATDERLGELVHEFGFDLVLNEVTHAGVTAWDPVRIDEHNFGTIEASALNWGASGGE